MRHPQASRSVAILVMLAIYAGGLFTTATYLTGAPALVLTQPAPGENLTNMPGEFKWRGIRGVRRYRVAVYTSSRMMWEITTPESKARWSAKDCDFRPGETYHWAVEALVGNTGLTSEAAGFTILSRESVTDLANALKSVDASVMDSAAAFTAKAQICLDARAFSKALEMLDKSIEISPSRPAYTLRAEIRGAIGLHEDAILDLMKAMAIPASRAATAPE